MYRFLNMFILFKPAPLFLTFREDFHPERNAARRRMCAMSDRSMKHVVSDVYFELSRRCPEFTDLEVCK